MSSKMVTSTKVGRSSTPRKPAAVMPTANKSAKKANTSILSFFKKTDKQEDSLFIGSDARPLDIATELYDADTTEKDVDRYNEVDAPSKRRRISEGSAVEIKAELSADVTTDAEAINVLSEEGKPLVSKSLLKGPFVMESDSDSDEPDATSSHAEATKTSQSPEHLSNAHPDRKISPSVEPIPFDSVAGVETDPVQPLEQASESRPLESNELLTAKDEIPTLKQEDSVFEAFDELGEFAELEGLDPDAFEGEEEREMLFMREQARLEAEADETGGLLHDDLAEDSPNNGAILNCPICEGRLTGISDDEASKHVNACLDGNPIPIPQQQQQQSPARGGDESTKDIPKVGSEEISKRFVRAAIPRPGQQNPLDSVPVKSGSKSAFSKLMSSNAEDNAWATAAAAEKDSRGRPAYERTCPFYKIMPGFSICVDAFRYGAVEGCMAYFLSHFHSDHYIGLTASWRHGPIYCSKVTGSLVRNQLRTAAKWVVELEFEKAYDVPGTGASVTMISANHCPGSSLFLFSKTEGKAPHGKTKRILHCGDFRACPAHVQHDLLKPDVLDAVSGNMKQQKIDICYLDTTYLNPRYSFPPQTDVIQASAELCASLSPDPDCTDDVWERSAKAIGTPAVSKFFQPVKSEDGETKATPKKPRQRLLVICGTYSIGKERICIAIAKALKSKIFASPGKIKICKQLQDPELTALLTSDPVEAQVHMQMLMEIRAETLQEYLNSYKPHFSRIVGFRPSGWNFRQGSGKAVGANAPPSSIQTQTILHAKHWRTRFGYKDFVAQRGSTKEAMCFGVPYSEHSSFRELAMFVMALRIDKVIPTVNVGSDQSRKRMKAWIDRWTSERKKGGLLHALVEGQPIESADLELWDGKPGQGGGAWW